MRNEVRYVYTHLLYRYKGKSCWVNIRDTKANLWRVYEREDIGLSSMSDALRFLEMNAKYIEEHK